MEEEEGGHAPVGSGRLQERPLARGEEVGAPRREPGLGRMIGESRVTPPSVQVPKTPRDRSCFQKTCVIGVWLFGEMKGRLQRRSM